MALLEDAIASAQSVITTNERDAMLAREAVRHVIDFDKLSNELVVPPMIFPL